jgi:hypothetical protein
MNQRIWRQIVDTLSCLLYIRRGYCQSFSQSGDRDSNRTCVLPTFTAADCGSATAADTAAGVFSRSGNDPGTRLAGCLLRHSFPTSGSYMAWRLCAACKINIRPRQPECPTWCQKRGTPQYRSFSSLSVPSPRLQARHRLRIEGNDQFEVVRVHYPVMLDLRRQGIYPCRRRCAWYPCHPHM